MRASIIGLLLVLLALPYALSDRPFAIPSRPHGASVSQPPTLTPLPGSADQWQEMLRTLVGALVGAGAAFYWNSRLQDKARRVKEMAAGNNALATIGHLYIVFRKVRRMMDEERARHAGEAPGVPLWLIFRPPLHFLSEDRHFDFEALAFLFESKNAPAHEELFHLEEAHRDLMGHVRHLRDALVKKQDKAEAVGLMNKPTATIGELREAVGARLIIEIQGELETLSEYIRTRSDEYLRVADVLRRALVNHFGAEGIIRIQEPPEPSPSSAETKA